MGALMGNDDAYVGGLLETLNLCFGSYPDAPPGATDERLATNEAQMGLGTNGIREVRAIQAEFKLFDVNRPLVQSLRALGVGGLWNAHVKRKWFMALRRLDHYPSNFQGLSGGKAIAQALADHLQDPDPNPVHFTAHDARTAGAQVLITPKDRPVFYLEQDFLTVSIPLTPRQAVAVGSSAPATP
jgi:hypothetical protein